LVVDDNLDVAYTLGLMPEEIGHEYHVVHDGREALTEADAFRPNVVLLDIGLPGMDGYDVCRAFPRRSLG
jgi:CheY-like chemotaxis protein